MRIRATCGGSIPLFVEELVQTAFTLASTEGESRAAAFD